MIYHWKANVSTLKLLWFWKFKIRSRYRYSKFIQKFYTGKMCLLDDSSEIYIKRSTKDNEVWISIIDKLNWFDLQSLTHGCSDRRSVMVRSSVRNICPNQPDEIHFDSFIAQIIGNSNFFNFLIFRYFSKKKTLNDNFWSISKS